MLNIKKEYLDELNKIFAQYCPKAEIWAYGSRIKNASHSGSDLDLTVRDFHDSNKSIGELRELLSNSNIKLPKYFQDEIMKKYIQIFPFLQES